jgi:signal transduction histidine kinase/CheY-like chemotaxis protein
MSKKKINNRLENLFATINDQEPLETMPSTAAKLISWSWETDANGIYTQCSNEVNQALGLQSSDFLGSPLLNCHIVKSDRKTFLENIQKDQFPFEVVLHMDDARDKVQLTRFHVFKVMPEGESQYVFRGFTQLLSEELEPALRQEPVAASLEPEKADLLPEPAVEVNEVENAAEAVNTPSVEDATVPAQETPETQEAATPSIEPITEETLDESLLQLAEELSQVHSEPVSTEPEPEKEETQPAAVEEIPAAQPESLPQDSISADSAEPEPAAQLKPTETAAPKAEAKKTERVVELPNRKGRQNKQDFSKLSKTAPLGPLPSFPSETPLGETAPLQNAELKGIALDGDVLKPSENVWTQQALVSFRENVVVSSPASEESPAIMVSPLTLRNQKTGVIELVDTNSERKWSEEDRLLLQEVSNQLGLALENAQLYSTVQKELSERIKAEALTERRNRDLATLNQVGQQLSRLISREEIFKLVASMLQETLDVKDLLISLYDSDVESFSFPVCIAKGHEQQLPSRLCGDGYQEKLLKSHAPLVLNKDPQLFLGDQEFDHPLKRPTAMLAVPLMIGERGLGVITLLSDDPQKVFDHVQVELVSTIATQTATSLENASLFENIRSALATIEVRERFQSNVTKAVATLSEKGSTTLPQILEYLAQAADCERTYYAEPTLEKDGGLVWSAAPIYIKEDANVLLSNDLLSRMVATEYPEWLNDLSLTGWHVQQATTAKGAEKVYLQSQKIESLLLLAIPRGENRYGFIAFENFVDRHEWIKEEIDILRIASDALTNTLIREELLKQVQNSLEETESLYSASHQLALASTTQEMLSAIIQGVHSTTINRGILILFDYNSNNQIERMYVEANYYSGVGTPPPPIQTEYLASLYSPIFITNNPVFYDNIAESEVDKNLQEILSRQNIHSMAILPLWSGSHQSGVLMLISVVKHRFLEQELRSLPPLADQMATAIENQRLFESTQEALAETELLYKISSGIAESTNIQELIELVGENALPEGAEALHLFLNTFGQEENASGYIQIGSYTSDHHYLAGDSFLPEEWLASLELRKGEPLVFQVAKNHALPEDFKKFCAAKSIESLAITPMVSAGKVTGFILASTPRAFEFEKEGVHTLQIVTNGISVGIERQRLLTETQRRALELQAAAELARDTTSTLSLDILLNRIVNQLQERFGFYHTAIYQLDETGTYLAIQEATGKAGAELKQKQTRIAIGAKSALGVCAASGNPELILDTTNSPIFYPNPLLPDTRSELALPLKISGKVTGALDFQSSRPNAFTAGEITVFQILADQISIAIENAHAYEISQQAVAEMRELDRVKNQFLANMSHELRTPLNSVIGFSRVILKGIDGPINDVQKQDISSIYSSGMHLLNMINEILDMSKIEAGKMELQLEESNISDIINSTVSTAMGLVKDKPVHLVQDVSPDLPLVKLDSIRIGQVLTNLIGNAIKFTEKGDITIGARLSESPEKKPEIMVTVKDSGIGIAPEDQSKLFQRFSQVDDSPTRKTGGTGLGLSICRSLVEMHKGRIGLLESEVGQGSTFFFTLPLEEPKEEISLDELIHEKNIILSIDDDPQVIALYERYLQSSGYQVIPETDPAKAVERAETLQPMAITLDIMMPGKDGWQVMHELKQNEATRNIPVLICSILEEEEKGISLGASDYLVKPFIQDDLIRAVHRLESDGELHNILIVDDDPADLRLTQKMLEDAGHFTVTSAASGRDALESLTNSVPDMIILDLFMPGLNGFDLLEIFRSDPKLSQVPVLILTGADLDTEQQKQLSEFGNHLLTKGMLKEKDLLKYIEESLNRIKTNSLNG